MARLLLAIGAAVLAGGRGCCADSRSPAEVSAAESPQSLNLTLHLVPQEKYPHAKCLDGTPAGYYFRPGRGEHSESIILFLEGGGW